MTGRVEIHRGNILDLDVDAIVNAANSTLMGGGGVDGAIHRAAGPQLREACMPLAPCPAGEVRVTPGFALRAEWVFHTVGPVWRGGAEGEAATLAMCYEACMEELVRRGLATIAFPAISTGAYGFPLGEAGGIAVRVTRRYAVRRDLTVYLAAFDGETAEALGEALTRIPKAD